MCICAWHEYISVNMVWEFGVNMVFLNTRTHHITCRMKLCTYIYGYMFCTMNTHI